MALDPGKFASLVEQTLLHGLDRKPWPEEAVACVREWGITESQGDSEQLLASAAWYSTSGRVGFSPGRCCSLRNSGPPTHKEERALSTALVSLWQQVMAMEWPALVNRVAAELYHAGWVLPGELLPAFFSAQGGNVALSPELQAFTGIRGAWLAPQNPAWAHLVYEVWSPETWERASWLERRAYCQWLRTKHPEQAFEWVQQQWGEMPAAERAKFLAILDDFLEDREAEWLEGLLQDKRKEVRHAAARLLRRLPHSPLSQRCISRVANGLRVNKKKGLLGFGKASVSWVMPVPLPDDWVKDGVGLKGDGEAVQEADYLEVLLYATPFTDLQKITQCDDEDWIQLLEGDETLGVSILKGHLYQLAEQPEAPFGKVLFHNWLNRQARKVWSMVPWSVWLDQLPAPLYHEFLKVALKSAPVRMDEHHPLVWLLWQDHVQWEEPVSMAVLEIMGKWLEAEQDAYQNRDIWSTLLQNLGTCAAPEVVQYAQQYKGFTQVSRGNLRRNVDDALTALQLRKKVKELL